MRSIYQFSIVSLFIFLSTLVYAQSNQYLHFDGEDDFAIVDNASQYMVGAEGVSMTGWFYTDALVYGQGFFGFRGPGTGAGEMYVIELANGKLECRFVSTDGFYEVVGPDGSGDAGVWQHVAWVHSGTEILLYIDGELIASNAASGTFAAMDRAFGIGKSIQSGFNFVFGGRIDEVSVWSKGLTQVEIQDMMVNELSGDEENLELYFKMNQGSPGGNNSLITELINEIGDGSRNATLMNFELIGATSNFNGELEDGFQTINFSPIPNKIITDPPFELDASVNSGLPITYELISGPATLNENTITLTGMSGEVVVKASQPGDDVFSPADDVMVNFLVLDPALVLPNIDLRNPVEGNFYASALSPILLASIVDVDFSEIFTITEIGYEVDGETVEVTDNYGRHQTGWWTPDSFGEHTYTVTATHSGGVSHSESVTFEIIEELDDVSFAAFEDVWVDADNYSVEIEGVMPSFMGSFEQILGTLFITCPDGGCDPWDRVSTIEVQGHDGVWYEIIRYLTPYGVACDHEIDLTDFSSLLQGKVRFRVNIGTQGNGFLYSLVMDYVGGVMDYPYSNVNKLWYQTYSFGDPANLQPTESIEGMFPDNAETAVIKLVSSGHGWGDNNTGNAAEFHHDIHHIWVNDEAVFEQDNWVDCNPNPDGCNPQNGTWYFDRAGWCPGSIAQFFDYDMEPYVDAPSFSLQYIFNENYVDQCHPNNPNCNSGVTCPDCNAGFNPHLIVTSYLITKGDEPVDPLALLLSVDDTDSPVGISFDLYPNPSAGKFTIDLGADLSAGTIYVFDGLGRLVHTASAKRGMEKVGIDLGVVENGVYVIYYESEKGSGYRKLVIEK